MTKKQPFFAKFLEGNINEELNRTKGGVTKPAFDIVYTDKYPSDDDEIVTDKYPSDNDELVTDKYPSDNDETTI
jgi:hypothetical protein